MRRRVQKGLKAALIISLLLFGDFALADELTGKGEWQSLSGKSIKGTWSVKLSQAGGSVQGNLDLTGSNVFSGGDVTGTVDASSIVLGVMVDGQKQAVFSGKLDGGSISGEWECDAIADHGVWYGSLATTKPPM